MSLTKANRRVLVNPSPHPTRWAAPDTGIVPAAHDARWLLVEQAAQPARGLVPVWPGAQASARCLGGPHARPGVSAVGRAFAAHRGARTQSDRPAQSLR